MKTQNILVPVDFSANSAAAVDYASSLANESGAELHLLHVHEDVVAFVEGFGGYPMPPDVEQIKASLEQVRPTTADIPFRRCFKMGHPADEIIQYAKENQIDLIVMGTHGRTGIDRLLIGSVAEGVVRRAPCPVLTIKQPVAAAADSQ